jgi:hypothetical protein
MTALAKDTNLPFREGYGIQSKQFTVKNGATVYQGSRVGIIMQGGDKGTIIPWTVVSGRGDLFLGFALFKVVGDGSLKCTVNMSGIELQNVAVTGASTATSIGEEVYATDDGTGLTLTWPGTNQGPQAWITAFFSSTQFDVRFVVPEVYRAWLRI